MLNKKGFTLLELLIVIIIIGVLATLGLMQYQTVVEKSRGAEARQVLSTLRSSCAAIWIRDGSTVNCLGGAAGGLGLSTSGTIVVGEIPGAGGCWNSNYFSYTIPAAGAGAGNTITFTADRCTATGKAPNTVGAKSLSLAIDYAPAAGVTGDSWSSAGFSY